MTHIVRRERRLNLQYGYSTVVEYWVCRKRSGVVWSSDIGAANKFGDLKKARRIARANGAEVETTVTCYGCGEEYPMFKTANTCLGADKRLCSRCVNVARDGSNLVYMQRCESVDKKKFDRDKAPKQKMKRVALRAFCGVR